MTGNASAQGGQPAQGPCWQRPDPETLEEAFKTSGNIRNWKGKTGIGAPAQALLHDVIRQAITAKGSFLFTSTKTAPGFVPQGEFDPVHLRNLFRHAYRQARMGGEWTREFPGLVLPASRLWLGS